MEILISMLAFFGLVASWFVLPATPPRVAEAPAHASASEALPSAA